MPFYSLSFFFHWRGCCCVNFFFRINRQEKTCFEKELNSIKYGKNIPVPSRQYMINHSVLQTLPKAQRSQGIEYFDSFNTFSSSKQNLRQAFKSRSNFVLVGKGGGVYKTTLTNPHINFDKSMLKLLEIHVLRAG